MKILLMAASLRQASLNKKLILLTAQLLSELEPGIHVDLADFAEFDMPFYHGDVNEHSGLPAGAKKFIARLMAADGMIIAVPEYNYSIPGALKNLIDWVSRDPTKPLMSSKILLMSASPSLVGGNRGLWHTRVPLEACGAYVLPEMFSLGQAHLAFNEQGFLHEEMAQQRLQANLAAFINFLQVFKK